MDISKLKHIALCWDEDDYCFNEDGSVSIDFDNKYDYHSKESTNRQNIAISWGDEWKSFNELYDMSKEELREELLLEYERLHHYIDIDKRSIGWFIKEFKKYKNEIKSSIENGEKLTNNL